MSNPMNMELPDVLTMQIASYFWSKHPELWNGDNKNINKDEICERYSREIVTLMTGVIIYCQQNTIDILDLAKKPIGELFSILDSITSNGDTKDATRNIMAISKALLSPMVRTKCMTLSHDLISIEYTVPRELRELIFGPMSPMENCYSRDFTLKIQWAPNNDIPFGKRTDLKAYSDYDAFVEGLTFKEVQNIPQSVLTTRAAQSIVEMTSIVVNDLGG